MGIEELLPHNVYTGLRIITERDKVRDNISSMREFSWFGCSRSSECIPWHTCENVDTNCLFLGRESKQIDTVFSEGDCKFANVLLRGCASTRDSPSSSPLFHDFRCVWCFFEMPNRANILYCLLGEFHRFLDILSRLRICSGVHRRIQPYESLCSSKAFAGIDKTFNLNLFHLPSKLISQH